MRSPILQSRGERRHGRRARSRRPQPPPKPLARACDPVVERVRAAGGPVDLAIYTCACGYLFRTDVTATVSCPHCGSSQAW